MEDPRFVWQQHFLAKYDLDQKRDFLLCATPGAGKTRATFKLAQELRTSGVIDRMIVVVPTDALKRQWSDSSPIGFALRAATNKAHAAGDNADYCGDVLTYAQLASEPLLYRRKVERHRTLVVFDEIHHAGQNKWGTALEVAFAASATRRLGLTGTPWRRESDEIPFVSYDDTGDVRADFYYGYGPAVRDGVVRPIRFDAMDGEMKWTDCGTVVTAQLGNVERDDDIPVALQCAYDPTQQRIPTILRKAHDELCDLRESVPNAGGLVVAQDQEMAQAYAVHLERITGRRPVLVISDIDGSTDEIQRFKTGTSEWLVAVKMVSEGVDIPRLAVGVYASKTQTPLFFRQVVGRFIRMHPDDQHSATLFMPALDNLRGYALELEEELAYAIREIEDDREREKKELDDRQSTLELRAPLSASAAQLSSSIYQGDSLTPAELAAAEAACRKHRIPLNAIAGVAQLLRRMPPSAPVELPNDAPSVSQRQQTLKAELDRLTKQMSYALRMESPKVANRRIFDRYGVRGSMTIDQLIEAIEWVASWEA